MKDGLSTNTTGPPALVLSEIQALLLRGYARKLPAAAYLLLEFSASTRFADFLSYVLSQLTMATESAPKRVFNVAFTYSGLAKLPMDQGLLQSFSTDFKMGMHHEQKSRQLGDVGANSPKHWSWGGEDNPVDAVLVCFAKNTQALEVELETVRQQLQSMQINCVQDLRSTTLHGNKEHFGFRDGISQPSVSGFHPAGDDSVLAGEFILGYRDHYGEHNSEPLLAMSADHSKVLPLAEERTACRSFAKNGSYLVFRQLHQDVSGFWQHLAAVTHSDASNAAGMIAAAAKMVGRWPDGRPLLPNLQTVSTHRFNDFNYREVDPEGFHCPLGSHIRRSNPRDDLSSLASTEQRKALVAPHRLLRRGRSYGEPVHPELNPAKMLEDEAAPDRGLLFLCVSANISRQFEFVQQSWINNPDFDARYREDDPIVGARAFHNEPKSVSNFTIPSKPLRKRMQDLPRFVCVRGGAYFFMPSKAALTYVQQVLKAKETF